MLKLSSVSMHYRNGHHAIEDISLEVEGGRITAVIGGSGCGKSTVLRLIAGLERPTSGTVEVDGNIVAGPSEKVGVIFQEPRLMPWLTVSKNVTFGLAHLTKEESALRSATTLKRVGLSDFADVLPKELSGGMAQRTALARALVGSPAILLLDEPFSALDALTRADLQQHLLEPWEADRQTLLMVTHDIDEALLLADQIVVMAGQPGRIVDIVPVPAERQRILADAGLVALRSRVMESLSAGQAGHL